MNWNWESEPEAGCGGRRIELPRGKVVGGSSSINAMVYMRGHPLDYDGWADGHHRWSRGASSASCRTSRPASAATAAPRPTAAVLDV